MVTECKEIFLGHTDVLKWNIDKPLKAANIHNLDTGACHHDKLTIINVDRKEYWQPDPVVDLYAECGR